MRAVQVDRLSGFLRVCPPVAQLFFRRKKEQPLANRKSKNRQKRKILAGTSDRRIGEVDRASLFSA